MYGLLPTSPRLLALLALVGAATCQAQVVTFVGPQITNPTGTLLFTWPGSVSLANYTEAGLAVTCNSFDSGQGCVGGPRGGGCCRPVGFSPGGYYYGGGIPQLVNITRADGGAMSALQFQVGDYYNGCAYPGGDGIIYVWALVYSGGNVTSFDINVPSGQYIGFSGVFDRVQVGAYVNQYSRDLHQPTNPEAIAMDNMSYVASTCPAFAAPSSIYACADGVNTFSIAAVGDNLAYQWQWQTPGDSTWTDVVDGANSAPAPFAFTASGAHAATLTRTGSLTPGASALYRCVVSNDCASVTSPPATIAITPAPTIAQQPNDAPLCTPGFTQFSVEVATTSSDPGPFTYQWQSSTNGTTWHNVANGENITGATTPYLNIVLDAPDAARYRCIVSNACSSTITRAAILSFNNGPQIASQPLDTTTCPDGTTYFDVDPGLTQSPYEQWQVESPPNSGQYVAFPNDGDFVDPNTGAAYLVYGTQSTELTVYNAPYQPAPYRFIATITNGCGSFNSDPAALTVLASTDPACGGGPACNPDVNQDGVADQGDVDYLINVIAGGSNPTNIDPDFNADGVADQGDIDALINVIAGGPCP